MCVIIIVWPLIANSWKEKLTVAGGDTDETLSLSERLRSEDEEQFAALSRDTLRPGVVAEAHSTQQRARGGAAVIHVHRRAVVAVRHRVKEVDRQHLLARRWKHLHKPMRKFLSIKLLIFL